MMNAGDIAFPHLGIYLENVPRSFSVFGFEIAFYGLIIGIGVLAGILMAVHQAKVTGENPDTIWDFAIYAVIFSVIGARIYYVVFAWDYYKDNLLSIFNTRNGGMAIYGGVIGAFLTLLIYCRIKKINPFRLGDLCVPGLILGQIIGRWGNFMKQNRRFPNAAFYFLLKIFDKFFVTHTQSFPAMQKSPVEWIFLCKFAVTY